MILELYFWPKLRSGLADLSRRFVSHFIPLLSFREYIFLCKGLAFPKINPFHANKDVIQEMMHKINVLLLFKDYLAQGMRPIFLEGNYAERMLNIIEKSIFSDVPFFVPQVHENHLRLMNAVVGHLAKSPIPTINIDTLTKEWAIGKEKLYQLLSVMENILLLCIIRKKGDTKVYTKGEKMFLYDPSQYQVLGGALGNIREAFVTSAWRSVDYQVWASVHESEFDYWVITPKTTFKVEVGGKHKKSKASDLIIRDDIDVPTSKAIPMWMLGMMY